MQMIDAELLRKRIYSIACENCGNPQRDTWSCTSCSVWEILHEINGLSATEAEPVKHGRWEKTVLGELKCSQCRMFAPLNVERKHFVNTKYCPHCGARMDGDNNA